MKAVQIIFSPTGGTQKVADHILKDWEMPITKVDLTDPGVDPSAISLEREDIVLIAVPSFGGRVPGLAAERLGRLQGNGAWGVIVCVYGNRAYEDTLVELQDILQQNGFRVAAAVSAVAEHSIIHEYAAGRPDSADAEELAQFGKKILEKVVSGKDALPSLPGNRPYKKSGGSGLVPKAGRECIGCGACAAKCPAQAICKDDPKNTDGKKCISCMRCVVQCPKSARKVNSAMVAAAALALKKACSERKGNELFL